MNRMTHSLVISSVLLTLGAGLMNVTAFAQSTQSNSAETQLCDRIVKVARPTLKRRGQPQDSQPAVYEERHIQVKCENPKAKIIQMQPENFVSLRFIGLKAVPESQAASLIRGEIPDFRSQRIPDFDVAEKGAAVLRDFLRTKGYFDAFVDVIRDEPSNSLTFRVVEGVQVPLGEIRFKGLKVFSLDELNSITGRCLARFGAQDGYDEERVEYCLRHATNFLRSQGYLQAKLDKTKVELTGSGVTTTVNIEEGALYRLGQVTIEGADAVSAADLRAMLPLRQGEVARADSISKWLFEDLRKSYGELGYIEYTAEPIPEFRKVSEVEGVVDFKVIIEEGDRFILRALEFEGELLPTAKFINESPLQPGDVYKASAYEAFVKQLNQSGLFEPIDQDRDGDFRFDHEEKLVSIRLKLRRRGNQ
jgi:outer membrane protein insertion porin family